MKNTIYLFDFDGTLVDSMPTYAALMIRILDDYGMEYPSDIIKTITPLGFSGTADYYVKMGVPASKEEIMAKMAEYALDAYLFKIEAKETVIDTLRELKRRGILVRYFDKPRLSEFVRITIGSRKQMETLIKTLKEMKI